MSAPESVGTIMTAAVDAVDTRRETQVSCERVYFSRTRGLCLRREIHFYAAQTVATVFDAELNPLSTIRTDGIPSRARVSLDGRYAAFTTFVSGHSYADAHLSTATLILDLTNGSTVANLEQFTVMRDGKLLQSADFNFWGVTFRRDSNAFFATLRTGTTTYLVEGDIAAKRMTVVYEGVECPSLSPDETRIAFKKLMGPVNWRLTVLNLSTLKETALSETRSVDDQAEWLDNDHVLYAMADDATAIGVSILSVAADGSGQPRVFAKGAASPAVIR